MKFSLFNPWPVYDVPLDGGSWPVPPRLCQPGSTMQGMQRGIEISTLADRLGFDYVTVAEHHYHPRQLSPNPLLSAAALAQHLTHAGVAVLGATLPLVNPIRTAEEIGMVDAMTGGKLLVGLFRGTPNEYLTYGTTPQETREVFEEAVDLIVEAWTQPEPFAWVGRHYDYRLVSVWPRPVTRPHPPVLVSANSPSSAEYAAAHRFKAGISFAPAKATAMMAATYREHCQKHGWTAQPEDVLHRSFCFVAETDAEAERIVAESGFGDMGKIFVVGNDYGVGAALRAAVAESNAGRGGPGGPAGPGGSGGPGGPGGAGRPGAGGPPPAGGRPLLMGSPDTVARQIREFVDETGVGHMDLVFNDPLLDFDHSIRAVELFGREVLPQVLPAMVSA